MIEPAQPDPTMDQSPNGDEHDAGMAPAFGPDSGPPLVAGGSVLQALGASLPVVPRVLLRDPDSADGSPVIRPSSDEMPERQGPTGRIQLQGEIARGGMGAVLKGRDTDLGREIAVKVLLETHQGKTELVQRFVEEAQISGQLQHPGIAPVFELGQFADRRPYFTMKLVKGKTLSALLAARAAPEAEELPRLLVIFGQVCQTLAYAHARGVIHRDLKPSNIMVGAYGEVQVMDWGLAKVLPQGGVAGEEQARTRAEASVIRTARSGDEPGSTGSLTQAGSVLGTPAYMAPEQARGDVELVDERADVFGLGAILCEILTGQPPFTGKGAEAQRKAQTARLDDACARLDACGAEADLIALARRCLAAEPWDRPRDARQVALAMTAYQESVVERLRQAELERAAAEARAVQEERTRQMAEAKVLEERKRRRVTLALAAAVLALAIVGGGGASWYLIERRTAEQDVATALEDVARHRDAGRWPEARAALERAEGRLGTWGLSDMRRRVRQARLDADLVAEIDEIRLAESEVSRTRSTRGNPADPKADAAYEATFAKYGIVVSILMPKEALSLVEQSPVLVELLAGLHDWLRIKRQDQREPLRALLEVVDEDAWRRSFRAAILAPDIPRLKVLANQPEALSQPPAVQFWLASKLGASGEIKEAESLLRQGRRQNPADFWLNYQLGLTLLFGARTEIFRGQGDRPEEAIAYFTAAIALRPSSTGAHNSLGLALQHKGDLDGAIAEYGRAISLNPNYPHPHNNLGSALFDKHNFDAARVKFQQAIALDPKDAMYHYNLGNALCAKGDLEGGIAKYREAITIDPKYVDAHRGLARTLLKKGDQDGAIAEMRQAIALEPTDAWTYLFVGSVLRDKGDLPGAIAAYRQAIAINSKLADAYGALGWVLHLSGDLDGAVVECHRGLALDPKSAGQHTSLGWMLIMKGDLDGAIAECRQAMSLDSNDADAYENLGIALREKGDFQGAVATMRRLIAIDPKMGYPDMALVLANCPDPKLRNPKDASAAAKKAIELDPNSAGAWHAMGGATYRAGQWREAIMALEKAVQLTRPFPWPEQHFFLAMAHERAGPKDEARKWYQQGVDWMVKHGPKYPTFVRNRAEAAEVLGLKDGK
jgi:serine/threonine-protein kinase